MLSSNVRYTLQINIMSCAIDLKGLITFMRRATASLTYSSLCLPDNIKEKCLENIPHYYYRDDGLKLWNIIHKFVIGVVAHYYTEHDVQEDSELQTHLMEIVDHGFLKNDTSGIPKSFHTVADLVKFVTMLIFTVSAQHAAVNNGQYPLGFYPEELLVKAVPLQKMEQFRKDLKALEGEIEARNKNLELPYDYFNPENVDNSVDV
ncbi:polyunsaturated fatty acid lipoxygenase ALOX8-like [Pygocentrus nattereri]|uniref:polyunsaturated fatty acid lipoxygenase ALOX8-like n=1 Tax=Pygocentrus nattereri TaxID=42514 RepID=UPI0018911BF9|nr:polyunsaturated fatty acid lipoxygenase ALOX8-like [Pygocentrus nattereri]